jgi:hypothetical protein
MDVDINAEEHLDDGIGGAGVVLAAVVAIAMDEGKVPHHDSKMTGERFTHEFLTHPNPKTFRELCRMSADCFGAFLRLVKDHGLRDGPHITAAEKLTVLLYILGQGATQAMAASRFQHSKRSIHQAFHQALTAVLRTRFLVRPSLQEQHEYITGNPNFNGFFDGCIGAMDGTHIPAKVKKGRQEPYINKRINSPTQNVLACCNFDMTFSFVYPGFEGSAHDSRVLRDALMRNAFPFYGPHTYYLADKGFPLCTLCLTPFRNVNYHQNQFQHHQPEDPQELFNWRHASCRNIIERSFGAIKSRFRILREMPPYKYRTQVKMVMACFYIHNFIKQFGDNDDWLDPGNEEDIGDQDPYEPDILENVAQGPVFGQALNQPPGTVRRDGISIAMWNAVHPLNPVNHV